MPPRRKKGLREEIDSKQVEILNVCPFAHYPAHPLWVAVYETQALAQAGAEVELLTFCGVIDNVKVESVVLDFDY